jgi:hypothetical protein
MRGGELVALRWSDVDMEKGRIRVERSLEQTNAGLSFKAPKTKAGRRSISIPPAVVAELRAHWRRQQEQRLALGLGRAGGDDLVLARPDGSTWPPDSLTSEWARAVRIMKLPKVTLHALRHTHVSQLIASGLDVVSVSRRIGHSNPTVTLSVYAHLFGDTTSGRRISSRRRSPVRSPIEDSGDRLALTRGRQDHRAMTFFDDADLVREVAADLVARHGRAAIKMAIDHEENARVKGHHEDADAWLDIASAAAAMVGEGGGTASA